jgi:hypothetical protein
MYGPPQNCKRKIEMTVGLRQCIRPLVECKTPGHDGFRPLPSLLARRSCRTSTDIRLRMRRSDRCAIPCDRPQTRWGFAPRLLCSCPLSLISVRFRNGPQPSRARRFCAAERTLDGEDRSGTWEERERGLSPWIRTHGDQIGRSIDFVLLQYRPSCPDQLVRQGHNRYILVRAAQQLSEPAA